MQLVPDEQLAAGGSLEPVLLLELRPREHQADNFEGLALQGARGNVERLRVRIATGNA